LKILDDLIVGAPLNDEDYWLVRIDAKNNSLSETWALL
jgi:hypothetical protein